jgi:predicted RNase H-like HicB family nuclease
VSEVPAKVIVLFFAPLRESRLVTQRREGAKRRKESRFGYNRTMKLKVVVHDAEEGSYWAEVPAIPGCATQGETFEELLRNLYEAVEGCLSVDVSAVQVSAQDRVFEIAV